MKLYQLANDEETYGSQANYWLVVSDDLEDEIAGPFPTEDSAQAEMEKLEAYRARARQTLFNR